METYDLSDPRTVAALWSYLQEPGDEAAGVLREMRGAATALELVLHHPQPPDLSAWLQNHPPARAFDWQRSWKRWRARIDSIHLHTDLGELEKAGGWLLYPQHPQWPTEFQDLGATAPVALWGRGKLRPTTGPASGEPAERGAVAIVGARACTAQGERMAYELGFELARAGVSVVSGGAFGIDIAAHRGAKNSGHTLAVMAGGILQLYPRAHLPLFADIVSSDGGIVTEVPPFWRPARWRFLSRNRLIAALAKVVVIVEASARSGAVVTLRQARELGREVAAFPGRPYDITTQGCNQAIRDGATLVTDYQEVLELVDPIGTHLVIEPSEDGGEDRADLSVAEQRVWDAMPKRAGASALSIAQVAGLEEEETLGVLARLTLKGRVQPNGEKFSRIQHLPAR